jgi:hypothetical protein
MSVSHVVVVFPRASYPRATTAGLRRWLSRGEVVARSTVREFLPDVLEAVGVSPPECGLAALRYAGQTGVAPDGWLAAADPAHLETRLRHLVLRPFESGEVTAAEVAEIFASMRSVFKGDGLDFEAADDKGYLRSVSPIAMAECSAECAGGRLPDEFMPTGEAAAAFHRLHSEVQMLLHDHPVNQRRRQRGKPAVNTLWFWGGGAVDTNELPGLPLLISDDPLFRGYWSSRGHSFAPWTPDPVQAANEHEGDVVITVPNGLVSDNASAVQDLLSALRTMLNSGGAGAMTLFLGDDVVVRIGRRDGIRFWRGLSPLLEEIRDDG